MHTIDPSSWSRRDQFEMFRDSHLPIFNVCADVDITETYRAVRRRGVSISAVIVYLIARTANQIPEFRQRIRNHDVVEHDVVHPSSTVLTDHELFSFCSYDFYDDFGTFLAGYETATAHAKAHPSLDESIDRDDLLFMTAIPWISFTSFSHPVLSIPVDSIPRFAWGRFDVRAESVTMPLSVQGHHALVDGLHVGRFFQLIQRSLQEPDVYLPADG